MNQIEMAQREIPAFQADLVAAHPGLITRLLRRAEASDDGQPTWMEHYAHPAPGGVSPVLQAQIEHAAMALMSRCIAGPRHTEVFIHVPRSPRTQPIASLSPGHRREPR